MTIEAAYNKTNNVIDEDVKINKNSNWIKRGIISMFCSKRLQGAFIMMILCVIGFYYYDPIMNWISPPPVVIPEPWYVFWK